ncbi:MAG: Sir2 family NAD-dependent protein deacetylase [Pseudomonadota bacterium]
MPTASPFAQGQTSPTIVDDPAAAADVLLCELERAERPMVLTGAGLSTDSGIPDFRSPDGVWTRIKPIEFDDFIASEKAWLEDWRRRFAMAKLSAHAEPNAAHTALAQLVEAGKVTTIVTQNIDGMHQRAGTPPDALIEIHGNSNHATCLDCGARMETDEAERTVEETGRSPRCTACGGLVKAAVISFGQEMPEDLMIRVQIAATQTDLILALGKSLAVYPVAVLPLIVLERGAGFIIGSKLPTDLDHLVGFVLRAGLHETFADANKRAFCGKFVAPRSH